jgi:hypothetical protein
MLIKRERPRNFIVQFHICSEQIFLYSTRVRMSPGPKSDIIHTLEYILPRVQQSVCLFVGIGSPPSPESECVPPPPKPKRGETVASGEGMGDYQFGRLEKSLAVCLLWDLHRYAMCIRDLQFSKIDGV